MKIKNVSISRRFLDETGDPTFFGKGKVIVVGHQGVSLSFGLGMVKFEDDLKEVRQKILILQSEIDRDSYLNRIHSVHKKIVSGGFFFHATDDPPEVRERLMRLILGIDCSLEIVIGRKLPSLFIKKHNGKDEEFYADLLSHLLKTKLQQDQKLVLTIAERGTSTRHHNLQNAIDKAAERFTKTHSLKEIRSKIVFDVQNPRTEPLLCITDYMCWAVHRVFERGEMRYYDYLIDKMALVIDLYDFEHYENYGNYYNRRIKSLTSQNRLCPPSP